MYDNDKSSHRDYGKEYKVQGSIKFYILNKLYFLNSDVNATQLYIKKYDYIHNISRFADHPRRFMLKKYSQIRHEFAKTRTNIIKVLKVITEAHLLISKPDEDISKLSLTYEPY